MDSVEKALREEGNIDPEIFDLLVELNRSGYITSFSCAGHPGGDEWTGGGIVFSSSPLSRKRSLWLPDEKKFIRRLVSSYGIKGLKFDTEGQDRGVKTIWFDALGESPWGDKDYV